MKLSEAIENLEDDLFKPGSVDKLDFQDAELLGIEALKAIQRHRHDNLPAAYLALKGETKE